MQLPLRAFVSHRALHDDRGVHRMRRRAEVDLSPRWELRPVEGERGRPAQTFATERAMRFASMAILAEHPCGSGAGLLGGRRSEEERRRGAPRTLLLRLPRFPVGAIIHTVEGKSLEFDVEEPRERARECVRGGGTRAIACSVVSPRGPDQGSRRTDVADVARSCQGAARAWMD